MSQTMEGRSTQEYWTFVGYRDYWEQELASVNAQVQALEERIAALQAAVRGMRGQEGTLRTLLSEVIQIPSICGMWRGARAAECFRQCTEGSLFGIYRGAADAAQALTEKLEAALKDLHARLDALHARQLEADRVCSFWRERVACYW